MKKLIQLLLLLLVCHTLTAQKITLVKKGKSPYTIVMPSKATLVEIEAAKVLQDYLYRITGVTVPTGFDTAEEKPEEILIGKVDRPQTREIVYSDFGRDGLLIRTAGKKLVITGGYKKGIIYGVYTFLDKYLGCRKFAAEVTYVPKKTVISLPVIDDFQLPAFAFRETYYTEVYDPEYMNWHKLHSVSTRGEEKSEWGYFVHTFHTLLNPEEYGQTNPEYFSYYNGERHAGTVPSWDGKSVQPAAQLCLTNPDVLEIVCKNLKAAIDKRPEALYWSVSQNDNVNYCRCEHCAALDEKYAAFKPEEKMLSTHGGEKYPALGMGSLLTFINQVADRFPDKIISTLAYQYTRVPPKGIVPRKNVNIMLCSIESSRNDPMEAGDKPFAEDLIGWGKLTDNILVWDYVIRFSNLLAPFPNLRILQPNLQFLHRNRVSAMFEQGNRDRGGEFANLRAYLISRMLWNPDIDLQKEMDEFLNGYYGAAAPDIKEYINLLHDHNQAGMEVKMSIFGKPADDKETFLSEALLSRYNAIFDRALKKVEKTPDVYVRVKSARLPVYYATLEIAKAEKTGPRGAFDIIDNKLVPKPGIAAMLHEFVYHCVRTGVSRIAEWHTTPKEYLEKYIAFLENPDAQ
ncbi:MAG: DUF4838 domain-containing protein [Chitinophagaceae bacterium]|nr:DUF4838 domain-containing protein [Chitinophagaceae bacterium]MCW5926012.1 DUF4838 domain-containing protein [Chitinophagaceae bacterium]